MYIIVYNQRTKFLFNFVYSLYMIFRKKKKHTILYFLCLVFQKNLHNSVYSIYTIFQLCTFNIHNFIHSTYTFFFKNVHIFSVLYIYYTQFFKEYTQFCNVHSSIFSKHKIYQFCILYEHNFKKCI